MVGDETTTIAPQQVSEGSEGEPSSEQSEASAMGSEASEAAPSAPAQSEMPFAMVHGKAYTELPKDLYIPPDALEVFLEAFEGPLDLLLYLIRRQNIDILEIDVSEITQQYIGYVEMMDAMKFELAAEYLVMAAMLAEIKSRMLLPRSSEGDEEEDEDPRATLIRRLQEYERFKQAAEDIDELPRNQRDFYVAKAEPPDRNLTRPDPEVDLKELLLALSEVLRRADMFESHHIEREKLSTRERMGQVLDKLKGRPFVPFVSLFQAEEGRLGVVVTFLAVLELIKESLVEIVQTEEFGSIHVKARSTEPSSDLSEDEYENSDSDETVFDGEDTQMAYSAEFGEDTKEDNNLELDDSPEPENSPELDDSPEPKNSLELKDSPELDDSLEPEDSPEPKDSLELKDSPELDDSLELEDSLEPEDSPELDDNPELDDSPEPVDSQNLTDKLEQPSNFTAPVDEKIEREFSSRPSEDAQSLENSSLAFGEGESEAHVDIEIKIESNEQVSRDSDLSESPNDQTGQASGLDSKYKPDA